MTDTIITASASCELPLEPGGTVDIVLSTGDLRVRGVDGDRVVVRSRDGRPLGDDIRCTAEPGLVRIRDAEGTVRFGPFSLRTHGNPDLDIDLPRTARVSLKTLSGDVEAHGIGGTSRWASASGDLRITTSAGSIQLETLSGDAILEASAALVLAARTVSGDLRVRAPRLDAIDAATTSGDIRIEAAIKAGESHSISSVSGDVEVATASPVRLEARTITGDVNASGPHRADGGRGRRTLTIGNGSIVLSVRTTSGDVRLRVLGGPGVPIPMPAPATPAARPPTPAAPAPVAPVQPAAPVPPIPPVAPVPPVADAARVVPPAPEPPVVPAEEVDAAADAPSGTPPQSDHPAPRPIDDEDTQAWNAAESFADRREAARLDVLRALERGDVDIETASRRLEALEQAGPRYFRGWC